MPAVCGAAGQPRGMKLPGARPRPDETSRSWRNPCQRRRIQRCGTITQHLGPAPGRHENRVCRSSIGWRQAWWPQASPSGPWWCWAPGHRWRHQSTFVLLDGSQQTTADLRGKGHPGELLGHQLHHLCRRDARYRRHLRQSTRARVSRPWPWPYDYDPPSYVVNFTETRKLPFKVAIDNTGAVAKAWGDVKLTPTTYIVNKRGRS